MHFDVRELIKKPLNNLSVPQIISHRGSTSTTSICNKHQTEHQRQSLESRPFLTVTAFPSSKSPSDPIQKRSPNTLSPNTLSPYASNVRSKNLLSPTPDLSTAKARIPSKVSDVSCNGGSRCVKILLFQKPTEISLDSELFCKTYIFRSKKNVDEYGKKLYPTINFLLH